MSALRFTIQDYTSGTLVSTVIDEPVGLDKVSLHIARDQQYHGFADMVDDSLGRLQFYGQAYTILKSAYVNYGIDAHLECLIEFQCGDDDTYETLYQGRFSLDSYSQSEGLDGCYAECIIKNSYNLTVFRSRMGQKVSLDSLATFDEYMDDGVTPYPPLTPYEGLGTQAVLQPMTIRMVNYASIDTNPTGSQLYGIYSSTVTDPNGIHQNLAFPCFASAPTTAGGTDGGIDNPQGNEFNLYADAVTCINPYANIRSAELGDFPGPVGDQFNGVYVCASSSSTGNIPNGNPIFTFTPDIPYANTYINIDIELSIAIFNGDSGWGGTNSILHGTTIDVYLMKGINWDDAQTHAGIRYDYSVNNGSGTQTVSGTTVRFDSVAGCLLDQQEIVLPDIASDMSSPAGYIGSAVAQYSYHANALTQSIAGPGSGKGIIMHPGEQLFFYV